MTAPRAGWAVPGRSGRGRRCQPGRLMQRGELLPRRVEADLEALGFAGPAFAFGFADPGGQVVADAFQPCPLSWVNAEEWAPDTAVLVRAAGCVGPAAVAEGDLAPLEVAKEFFPFLVAGDAVLFAGPGGAAAGDE